MKDWYRYWHWPYGTVRLPYYSMYGTAHTSVPRQTWNPGHNRQGLRLTRVQYLRTPAFLVEFACGCIEMNSSLGRWDGG